MIEQTLAGLLKLVFQGRQPLVGSKNCDLIRRVPGGERVVFAEGKVRLDTLQPIKDPRLEPGKRPVDVLSKRPLVFRLEFAIP